MENIREIIRKNSERILDKKFHGMTLKEIARLTGVSETTIQRWKNGENTPEINNIEKLAEVLRIDPMEFFRRGELEQRQDLSLDVMNQIVSLGPTELEMLLDTLKALSKPLPIKAQKKKEA